jgi:cytochrome P450
VVKSFTPRAVEQLRQKLKTFIDRLVDELRPPGEMDVIADLALPVPSFAICDLLGVPFADHALFAVWTAEATNLLASALAPIEVIERGQAALEKLHDYFDSLIAERRENLRDDVLSELIRAEESGDKLGSSELLAQCRGLLIAGFETTIGLIGNAMLALLTHPNELKRLKERPDLIGPAVEECLRFDGPIVLTPRYLREDAVFGGVLIPEGAQVWAMLLAANRDPARFRNPDRFDIARKDNQHIAFGGGSHFCLGAHLARMEATLTIDAIVRRLEGLELMTGELEWGRSLFRVLRRLPVRFEAVLP